MAGSVHCICRITLRIHRGAAAASAQAMDILYATGTHLCLLGPIESNEIQLDSMRRRARSGSASAAARLKQERGPKPHAAAFMALADDGFGVQASASPCVGGRSERRWPCNGFSWDWGGG